MLSHPSVLKRIFVIPQKQISVMEKSICKIIAVVLIALCPGAIQAGNDGFGKFKGVWASAKQEAVITDSVMMYFAKDTVTGNGSAALCVPSRNISMLTTFTADTILTEKAPQYQLALADDGTLSINGERLMKVEGIDITQPYDMPYATDKWQIDRCLQEWQLGTVVETSGNDIVVMVGTNRNSFMYGITGGMVYLRAAALLHCNEGSLFIQNIRMMKNPNTKERSNIFFYDSHEFLTHLPRIDKSKFKPEQCVFAGDGFIYWSYQSHTPDEIKLNGCGETYTYKRTQKGTPGLIEWIKYEPQK